MKTPRYTDLHRYQHGYKKATETDITGTFKRIRRELEAKPKAPIVATIERKKA